MFGLWVMGVRAARGRDGNAEPPSMKMDLSARRVAIVRRIPSVAMHRSWQISSFRDETVAVAIVMCKSSWHTIVTG